MSRLRGTLALLSLAGATPLSLALLAAALAPGWWAGELLGHLRLHMAAALLLCAPALIWRTRWGLLALAPAALGLAGLAPLLAPRPPARPLTAGVLRHPPHSRYDRGRSRRSA